MPPRTVKSKKAVASKKKKKKRQPVQPISDTELVDHVSNLYIYGPGGVLRDTTTTPESETSDFLKKLDRHPALVLNADYQPMSILPLSLWRWQDAIKAVLTGKAQVVDVYDQVAVRAANYQVPLPSVIALTDYVPVFDKRPAFTKRNVFLRDEYRCQYCLQHFHTRDLTLDHVVPRSRGGRLQWTNAVACCKHCNGRKGSLAVSELRRVGMKLHREPFVPSQYQLASIAGRMLPRQVHETWEPYMVRHEKSDGDDESR